MTHSKPHGNLGVLKVALEQSIEAQVRYYKALGEVTTEYWRTLSGIASALGKSIAGANVGTASSSTPAAQSSAAALVLEAASGEEASCAFIVQNKLPHAVSAPVIVSEFRDPHGIAVGVAVSVSPASVNLAPGAEEPVRISARIDPSLSLGTDYRAEVSVPGLSSGRVHVVMRRRAIAAVEGTV